jgi:DsbC/DsbD-like thiol-disulfide interchange protein
MRADETIYSPLTSASRRIQFRFCRIACRRHVMTARKLWHVSAIGLGLALAAQHAHAADASTWDGDARSAVRLIAGAADQGDGTLLRAGLEIRLAPGWKTYWRYPGDAGVPPRFDLAHSSNVKSTTLSWPAPQRFSDGGSQSIGYDGDVIFPVRIVPQDPARPVVLRLKLDYAICEKLCVPAEGSVELSLAPASTAAANESALAAAEARVPKPATIGDKASFAVRAMRQEPGTRLARVVIDVAAPNGASVDLFAEGPTPEWALPLPAPVAGAPAGLKRFAFELDGLPLGQTPQGAVLTLTAVAGESAIEVKAPLD